MQSKFLIGVIQQFQEIRNTTQVTWVDEFQNVLMNCQSVIDYDLDEIRSRLVGREDPPGKENMLRELNL